jgi:5-methylcytosine-specific restriction protein A
VSIDGKALPDAGAYHVRVALRELSRREILQAVAEYDRLGQERFLEKYGFGAARSYRLVVDGKTYDSKAIAGAGTASFQVRKRSPPTTSAAGRRPSDAC